MKRAESHGAWARAGVDDGDVIPIPHHYIAIGINVSIGNDIFAVVDFNHFEWVMWF